MNMRYWKAAILFIVAFLIQTSLLNLFAIAGHTPNLLLCLVIVLSFVYEGKLYGLVYGAIFGLLYDMTMGTVLGPTAICLAVVAILILIIRDFANIENIINLWVVAALSIAVYYVLNWVILHLLGNPLGIVYMLKELPISAIYSMVVVTVIYSILIRKAVKHRKDRYFG
jgi:rod shape-determining protein MreD